MAREPPVVRPKGLGGNLDLRRTGDLAVGDQDFAGKIGESSIMAAGHFRADKRDLGSRANRVFFRRFRRRRIRFPGVGGSGFLHFVRWIGTARHEAGCHGEHGRGNDRPPPAGPTPKALTKNSVHRHKFGNAG